MTTDKKPEGDRASKEKTPKPKENGKKVEKITPKAQGGTNLVSLLTTLALIGVTVALVVTVHKLSTQLASEKKLYAKQLQELEADVSSAKTKATVAESEQLDALSKVNRLENQVTVAKADARSATNAKIATDRTILEVETLKERKEKQLQEAEKKATKLQNELSSVKNTLETTQVKNHELLKKKSGLEAKLKEKDEQLKLQEDYNQRASNNLAVCTRKETKRVEEVKTLQTDLKKAQDLLTEKTDKLNKAAVQIKEKEAANAEVRASLQKAEVEVAAIKGVLKTNQDVIDIAAISYGELEKNTGLQIKKLQEDRTRFENANLEKDKLVRELQDNLNKWQEFGRQKENAEAQLTKEKTDQLVRIQELENKITNDQNVLKEKDVLVNEKIAHLAQREQQVNNLNGEMNMLKQIISERDATVLGIQTKWNEANAQAARLQQELQGVQAAAAQQAQAQAVPQAAAQAQAQAAPVKPTPA